MKSVLPIAAGIFSVGVFIYLYMKQRDKDKKKKSDNDGILSDTIETLEFNVTNEQVPLIVGRNSVNLKSIEEKTSTTIRFREGDKNNQVCSIKGKPENVKNAKKLVDVEAEKPIVLTDEIMIPINSIEGYSGSVLQEICQKSSTKIWIDPGSRKQQSDTRRVLITGTKEQVDLGKKLIEEKINEAPSIENNEEKKDEVRRSPRGSMSPYASNSSITTTESPREILIPTPEKLKGNDGQLEVFVSAVASPSRFA
jgi:KH domain